MSHDLDTNRWGQADAMFAKVAWHRLGTVVGQAFDLDAALTEGLEVVLPVEKVAMTDLILGYEAQPDEFAAVRGGRVLATGLGEQWTPYQVADAYALGQCIRETSDGVADLLSIGAIDRGRKWFMTYDLGEFEIGDYKVADYLSINGSFDSSWVLSVLTSPIIEVCANTIAAAKAMGIKHYRFKHTSKVYDRVEAAKRALTQHRESVRAIKAVGEQLLLTPVAPVQYSRLVEALFPMDDDATTKAKNVRDEAIGSITSLYKGAGAQVDSVGNGWSVVQAVNTYENWGTPVRKTGDRSNETTRALRQVEMISTGTQPLTDKVIDLVLALN